jgi:hypothetical protein
MSLNVHVKRTVVITGDIFMEQEDGSVKKLKMRISGEAYVPTGKAQVLITSLTLVSGRLWTHMLVVWIRRGSHQRQLAGPVRGTIDCTRRGLPRW